MATTIEPPSEQASKQLINYRAESGVAVIEMNDPPANTYTYEMNRQLDDAILKARMANDVYVIVLTGAIFVTSASDLSRFTAPVTRVHHSRIVLTVNSVR